MTEELLALLEHDLEMITDNEDFKNALYNAITENIDRAWNEGYNDGHYDGMRLVEMGGF